MTKHTENKMCRCRWPLKPPFDNIGNSVKQHTKSTADQVYILCSGSNIQPRNEKAISLLNTVIATEGNYSLSVVILPKSICSSGLLDENLGNELMKSSVNYVVFSDEFVRPLFASEGVKRGGTQRKKLEGISYSLETKKDAHRWKRLHRCWI